MQLKHPPSIDGYRPILLLPALSALAGLVAFWPAGITAIGLITFLLITLGAVLLSTFLLGYEMHQNPPLSQSFGSVGKSLPSAGKPLLSAETGGGGFIGLNCLTGNLIALSLAGLTDPKNLLILSWLNVLVVPYVLFAIFYQRRPVRQWSIWCLGLPVVLAGAPLTAPETPALLKMAALFSLSFVAATLQFQSHKKNQENLQRPGISVIKKKGRSPAFPSFLSDAV